MGIFKKTISILVLIFFVVSMTAASASAGCSKDGNKAINKFVDKNKDGCTSKTKNKYVDNTKGMCTIKNKDKYTGKTIIKPVDKTKNKCPSNTKNKYADKAKDESLDKLLDNYIGDDNKKILNNYVSNKNNKCAAKSKNKAPDTEVYGSEFRLFYLEILSIFFGDDLSDYDLSSLFSSCGCK